MITSSTSTSSSKPTGIKRGIQWTTIKEDDFHRFKVPANTKFGGGPKPLTWKIRDYSISSATARVNEKRRQIANKPQEDRSVSEEASALRVDRTLDDNTYGDQLQKASYHEAAICEENLTKFAEQVTGYLQSTGSSSACFYILNCIVAREEVANNKGTIDADHKKIINLCKNLFNVLEEIGSAANGATCTFTGNTDNVLKVYRFELTDTRGNNITMTESTIFSKNISQGGRKTYRKSRKHQRKTRKQLKKW